jgi:hypothetical protein
MSQGANRGSECVGRICSGKRDDLPSARPAMVPILEDLLMVLLMKGDNGLVDERRMNELERPGILGILLLY